MSACLVTYFIGRSRFFYSFLVTAAATVLIVIGFLALSYHQLNLIYGDLRASSRAYQIKENLTTSVEKIAEAEGRMRAYGQTGNEEFVRNYPELRKKIRSALAALRQQSRHTGQQAQMRQFIRLVDLRLRILDSVHIHQGYTKASDQERNIHLLYAGRLMERIRAVKDRLQHEQIKVLVHAHAQARQSVHIGVWMIYTGGFLLVAVMIQIAVLMYKYISKHRQAEAYQRELNEQKSRFFSIVSHDLRGPVHAAHTLLQMMDDRYQELSDADRQLMRQTALATLGQTANLLESLLAWSKTQMNQLHFSPQKVNLHELILRVMDYSRPIAEQKQITLSCTIHQTIYIQADVAMFEVILRNLISNAIKFTLPGGQVMVAAGYTDGGVRITVSDTGIGMSEQVRRQIFQLDSKHSSEGTGGEKGSGLGLVLTQQFVEKHGGQIRVRSELGKGSVFEIQLHEQVYA